MPRALWKGTLGFGLVSIPVELHTAVRDLGPRFNFLRRSDMSRISFLKVAKEDGEAVPPDQLVRGYEYEKGRYVILEKEDFEAAAVKRDSRIELLDFVSAEEVDDRFFDKPYYLLPAKGGEKAYALLREAMRASGRIGVAKIVLRRKSHLAAVETVKDALVLSTMRFREEVIPVADYEFPTADFRKQDLQIANQLIEALVANWDPDKYTDEYRANLMRIIEAKRKRQKPKLEKQEAEADAAVVDLMERLRRSLGRAAGGRVEAKRPRRGPAAKGRASAAGDRRTARGKGRKRARQRATRKQTA